MPKPSVPTRTAYVDDRAQAYDRQRFTSRAGKAIGDMEMDEFKSALARVPFRALTLEVGCGTGRFLLAAHEAGMRCEGLDPSPDMLQQVRSKVGADADLRLTLGEGRTLPYPDGQFDFVYSIRVLNQTESSDYALGMVAEMLRVTRPGGLVLVEFANYYRPRRRVDRDVRLRPAQVEAAGAQHAGQLVALRGVFFLGMTAFHRVPGVARPLLQTLDTQFSRALPRLCARCYAIFKKL